MCVRPNNNNHNSEIPLKMNEILTDLWEKTEGETGGFDIIGQSLPG